MQRKGFSDMQCPIARGLEHVGEWWSILILRDALRGLSRFDEFSESPGIAPNMLTSRLAALVEAGLIERQRYNEHPPGDAYVLIGWGGGGISGRCCWRCWRLVTNTFRPMTAVCGSSMSKPART